MRKGFPRARFFSIIFLVLVTMAVSITAWDAARFRAAHQLALENHALAEARSVRETIHRSLDVFPLNGLPGIDAALREIVETDDAVSYAYITDDKGLILYHTQSTRIGTQAEIQLFQDVVFNRPADKAVFEMADGYEVVVPLLQMDAIVGTLHVAVARQVITARVRALVLSHIVPFVVVAAGISLAFSAFMSWYVQRPLARLTQGLEEVAAGNFGHILHVAREDEVDPVVQAFNAMTASLQEFIANLEQQVVERTHALDRRSAQLRAATDVGRVITSILDVELLIEQVVTLIRQRFQMYYVGLFLVDETGNWAVLRAGDGAAGEALLDEGFRMPVGEGLIGWCIINAQPRLASDVRRDSTRVDVRELPNTRSEVALPLRSRGQVIGALSVQSDAYDAFDAEFMEVLQTLADEAAVAIDNARLFARSQAALEAERKSYGELTRRAWQQMLASRETWGYDYEGDNLRPAEGDWDAAMAQARQVGRRVTDASDARLAIPIRERQEVVGVLGFEKMESDAVWSAEEIALLETLAERLGVALESARSYQETQKQATREQLIGAVTTRIRESLDIDHVLQTAVDQIREALGLHEAVIQLGAVDVFDLEQ